VKVREVFFQKEFQSSKRRFQRTQDRTLLMEKDSISENLGNEVITNAKQK